MPSCEIFVIIILLIIVVILIIKRQRKIFWNNLNLLQGVVFTSGLPFGAKYMKK